MPDIEAEILIVGGGLGGVAAALAALRAGRQVVLTEEFDWLGGQLTSQAVPPDEHSWVEQFGITASYRALRSGIRNYYRRHYPLTTRARARRELNPGGGHVSRLCHDRGWPWPSSNRCSRPTAVRASFACSSRTVRWPSARTATGSPQSPCAPEDGYGPEITVTAPYVLDATEPGELLPLARVEYVTGFEAQDDTGEPSAPSTEQPMNMQAVSVCFAVDHVDGDHTIDRPARYGFWRDYQPRFWGDRMLSFRSPDPRTLRVSERSFTPNPDDDPLLVRSDQRINAGDGNLWTFRRIAARRLFEPGTYASDICLVNWPMIDYFEHPVIDVPDAGRPSRRGEGAVAVRPVLAADRGASTRRRHRYPGLRLRGDVTGSEDGLAQAPYIRESRRIRAEYTVVEQDLSLAVRGDKGAVTYADTVGIGMYRIDLHPSTAETTTSTSVAVPSRSRWARSSHDGWRTSCPPEEHRHHAHHQRFVPAAPGRVERRRGRRRTRRVLPGARRDAASGSQHPQPIGRLQAHLARDGVELRWPDVAGYRHITPCTPRTQTTHMRSPR